MTKHPRAYRITASLLLLIGTIFMVASGAKMIGLLLVLIASVIFISSFALSDHQH